MLVAFDTKWYALFSKLVYKQTGRKLSPIKFADFVKEHFGNSSWKRKNGWKNSLGSLITFLMKNEGETIICCYYLIIKFSIMKKLKKLDEFQKLNKDNVLREIKKKAIKGGCDDWTIENGCVCC